MFLSIISQNSLKILPYTLSWKMRRGYKLINLFFSPLASHKRMHAHAPILIFCLHNLICKPVCWRPDATNHEAIVCPGVNWKVTHTFLVRTVYKRKFFLVDRFVISAESCKTEQIISFIFSLFLAKKSGCATFALQH
jgi:hypothetical protein